MNLCVQVRTITTEMSKKIWKMRTQDSEDPDHSRWVVFPDTETLLHSLQAHFGLPHTPERTRGPISWMDELDDTTNTFWRCQYRKTVTCQKHYVKRLQNTSPRPLHPGRSRHPLPKNLTRTNQDQSPTTSDYDSDSNTNIEEPDTPPNNHRQTHPGPPKSQPRTTTEGGYIEFRAKWHVRVSKKSC